MAREKRSQHHYVGWCNHRGTMYNVSWHGGTAGKVMGSLKSSGFSLQAPLTSEPNSMEIHPIVVEHFSMHQNWTDRLLLKLFHNVNQGLRLQPLMVMYDVV